MPSFDELRKQAAELAEKAKSGFEAAKKAADQLSESTKGITEAAQKAKSFVEDQVANVKGMVNAVEDAGKGFAAAIEDASKAFVGFTDKIDAITKGEFLKLTPAEQQEVTTKAADSAADVVTKATASCGLTMEESAIVKQKVQDEVSNTIAKDNGVDPAHIEKIAKVAAEATVAFKKQLPFNATDLGGVKLKRGEAVTKVDATSASEGSLEQILRARLAQINTGSRPESRSSSSSFDNN